MLRGERSLWWVVWLIPAGRAFLRTVSALALALVLTVRDGRAGMLSTFDVLLLV